MAGSVPAGSFRLSVLLQWLQLHFASNMKWLRWAILAPELSMRDRGTRSVSPQLLPLS